MGTFAQILKIQLFIFLKFSKWQLFIRKVSLQADRRRAGAKLIKSSAIYGMINQ
jgi:hypothetical protein